MQLKFTIPIVFSLNVYIRLHYLQRDRIQYEINEQVYWEVRRQFKSAVPRFKHITMNFELHCPHRLDLVNSWALVKVIEDAVRYAELIPDDNPDFSTPHQPTWVKDKDKYVQVTLEVG